MNNGLFFRKNDARRERNIIRLRRTIKLLCWIGAIFCICWLPFNLLNVIYDYYKLGEYFSEAVFCGVYAACHVLGMSSACANPVIYGFLNENFSKEFRLIGQWWKVKLRSICSCIISNLLCCRRNRGNLQNTEGMVNYRKHVFNVSIFARKPECPKSCCYFKNESVKVITFIFIRKRPKQLV